jgi:hypothetical protein
MIHFYRDSDCLSVIWITHLQAAIAGQGKIAAGNGQVLQGFHAG